MILALRLGFIYSEYREFITKPFFFTTAKVLHQYPKEGKYGSYKLLKLHTQEGLTLYLSARDQDFSNAKVRIQIFPTQKIGYQEYLNGFFIKGYLKEVTYLKSNTFKEKLKHNIKAQHTHHEMIEFYHAIYLATPLSREFRQKVATLGVSHLIALSGLHLTILSSVIFFILWLLYHPLQKRYFPYRHAFIDIGLMVLLALGFYTYFVGMPPSLVRSYAMLVIGWIALVMGFRLLSFEFLLVVVLALLALFPKLIVSLALWFSISGVFYIYLIDHYTQAIQSKVVKTILFPIGIYLFMLPITHLFFDTTALVQLSSPLTSILFTFFYPFSIGLHLIGQGGLLDSMLLNFFALGSEESYGILLDISLFVGYLVLSIASIWSRIAFAILVAMVLLYATMLYIPL
ncbi:MAG: ComEC/Rec2 family competence protein [Campylobacterota bacterium]|nr:ComEC/Rec2 family competence protein [Campylobacterota bacterium]